jgi:predicted glycosyltransferase
LSVSAGFALGTPVWTTFAGRLGAVDEGLIADGRLAELTDADALVLAKKTAVGIVEQRDPELMLELLLSALEPTTPASG